MVTWPPESNLVDPEGSKAMMRQKSDVFSFFFFLKISIKKSHVIAK